MERHEGANKSQEDYLVPTPLEQINEPEKDNLDKANLSHGELQQRLDHYSKIGGMMDQYIEVQSIKKKYLKQVKDMEIKHIRADIHYAQGIRTGLPHTDIETLKDMQERHAQEFRNATAKEAKDYYKENNSLSKTFKEKQPNPSELRQAFSRIKNDGKDINRDR